MAQFGVITPSVIKCLPDKYVSFRSNRLTFLHYILLHTTDILPVQKNIWKYQLNLCDSPNPQQVDARDTEHTILWPEKNNLAQKLNFTEVVSTDNLSEVNVQLALSVAVAIPFSSTHTWQYPTCLAVFQFTFLHLPLCLYSNYKASPRN